jgi:hypothetical protein
MTSKAVHALVVAHLLVLRLALTLKTRDAGFALAVVTGIVTKSFSDMLNHHFFSDTVAF